MFNKQNYYQELWFALAILSKIILPKVESFKHCWLKKFVVKFTLLLEQNVKMKELQRTKGKKPLWICVYIISIISMHMWIEELLWSRYL